MDYTGTKTLGQRYHTTYASLPAYSFGSFAAYLLGCPKVKCLWLWRVHTNAEGRLILFL